MLASRDELLEVLARAISGRPLRDEIEAIAGERGVPPYVFARALSNAAGPSSAARQRLASLADALERASVTGWSLVVEDEFSVLFPRRATRTQGVLVGPQGEALPIVDYFTGNEEDGGGRFALSMIRVPNRMMKDVTRGAVKRILDSTGSFALDNSETIIGGRPARRLRASNGARLYDVVILPGHRMVCTLAVTRMPDVPGLEPTIEQFFAGFRPGAVTEW